MAKNISKHELAYLARLANYAAPPDAAAAQLCAIRMERTLNSQPRHGKTRAYVATLPKRNKPVRVSPEEFQRCKAVAVRQLAAKIVAEEKDAVGRKHSPLAIATRQDRVRPRIALAQTQSYRERLFEAQDGLCGSCGFRIDTAQIGTLDHVIPRARGGSNDLSNLLLMHWDCNNRKGDNMPGDFELQRNAAKNERLAGRSLVAEHPLRREDVGSIPAAGPNTAQVD